MIPFRYLFISYRYQLKHKFVSMYSLTKHISNKVNDLLAGELAWEVHFLSPLPNQG